MYSTFYISNDLCHRNKVLTRKYINRALLNQFTFHYFQKMSSQTSANKYKIAV